MNPPSPPSTPDRRHGAWRGLCVAGILAFVVSRWLVYGPVGVEGALADSVFWQFHQFVFVWAIVSIFYIPLLGLFLLFLLVRRRRALYRDEGRWRLSPWLLDLLWMGLVLAHWLYDPNPGLLVFAVLALIVVVLTEDREARVRLGGLGGLLLVGWILLPTGVDGICLTLWAGCLALLFGPLQRGLGQAERRFLGVASVMGLQLLAGFLPLLVGLHGGQQFSDDMAYSFCESPKRGLIYAAIPRCDTNDSLTCTDGHIAAYRTDDLSLSDRIDFFTEDYYGRVEFLVCLEDAIQVGMSNVSRPNVPEMEMESALELQMDNPSQHKRDIAGTDMGHRLAWDAKRDQIVYVSEWFGLIARYDRNRGTLDRGVGDWYEHPMTVLGQEASGSLAFGPDPSHPGRDSVFASEWFGPDSYEIALGTLQPKRHFQGIAGGSELAVDVTRNRILVANAWGLDVFDILTGERLARRRLGFVNRHPVIDSARGVVYVPATVSGRLYVLDAEDYELLGEVAVGYGLRYAHLQRDGARFIASSNAGIFAWDAAALAGAFGRPRSGE